jgi:translocation and assembly module TamB
LHELQISEVRAEQGSFQLDYPGPDAESRLELDLQQLSLPQGTLDQVTLNGNGRLAEHQLEVSLSWPSGALAGSLSGGWQDARWTGLVSDLHGHEDQIGAWRQVAQASLQLSRQRIAVDQLQLVDEQGGVVFLDSSMQPQPLAGSVRARWQELSLGFLNPFLAGPDLDGAADGELQLDMRAGGSLELTMQLAAAPVLQWQGRKLAFAASSINARWGSDGLEADAQLALAGGGQASFSMTSTEPGRLRQPERAELSVSWKDLELSQLSPWLPAELALSGQWHGNFAGNWRKGAAPGLSGRTWIDRGGLLWQGADGVVELPLAQAELNGDWRDGWSEGTLNLQLGEQGRIKGRFRLPTGQDNPSAPLTAEADFSIEELGLLMLLMPGISQETHGLLTGDLRLAGTWAKPELFGKVSLRGASAEVPNLGLQLHDAEFDLSFSQTRLKLERLQLRSGEGRLTGDGEVWLTGWRPQRWALNLKGDNLRLVHLPEITLEAAPDLQLSGTPELLTVRGEVTVPTLLISEVPRTRMVEPSEDVVLTDATAEAPSKVFKQLDVKLQVKLGEHVAVKAKGLDARLEGDLVVSSNQSGAFVGQGEIRVAQGHYAAYGLKLPISHGRAAFGGGALESPNLDVLAERTIGEVKAGVQVTGTPRKPVVKLVSEPSLPDTEILSYIVLGRPLNATGGDQSNLMLAAGALLSQGESAALQEKLKRSFGLDTIEVQSGGEQGVEGSMVAVGKYLTPELYLSFGQSLFTRESVAKLRYEISQRWELESQFGTVSGADLSYRIEFR